MLRPREHGDALVVIGPAADDVGGVVVVHHRMAGDDVDAADRVDELDEPKQADPYVVVDVDAEVLLHGRDRRTRAAVRVRAVDLSVPAGREMYVKVARD